MSITKSQITKRLKQEIISSCNLIDIEVEQITDEEPLFGPSSNLGIDSLDALEIALILKNYFGLQVKDKNEQRKVFTSVESLANFIISNTNEEKLAKFIK